MKAFIPFFNKIHQKVKFISNKLNFNKYLPKTGRKLALSLEQYISLSLYKQSNGIPTKISIYKTFNPNCSYKTLVVNMNRFAILALVILKKIMDINIQNSHPVKHTDSTDIPVCLNKNAKSHKVMQLFAKWGHSSKGWYFGLKLHKTDDLLRKLLAFKFTPANTADKNVFLELNKDLSGIFVADAGYTSEQMSQEFYQENKRILFVKPKKNMKKIITDFDYHLYNTRFTIEWSFRNLKMFYNLITSLPRSIDGYLANYIYSLLAYSLV
jgi:hypothetical protein